MFLKLHMRLTRQHTKNPKTNQRPLNFHSLIFRTEKTYSIYISSFLFFPFFLQMEKKWPFSSSYESEIRKKINTSKKIEEKKTLFEHKTAMTSRRRTHRFFFGIILFMQHINSG